MVGRVSGDQKKNQEQKKRMQQGVQENLGGKRKVKKNNNIPIPASVCKEVNVSTRLQFWHIRQGTLRKKQVTSELSGSTALGCTRCLQPVWLGIITEH
jgi:hypothetical protein